MFFVVAFFPSGAPAAQALSAVIDNERVAVWKVSDGDVMRPPPSTGESIEISLGPSAGAVVLRSKGDARRTAPPAVVVELKDHPTTARINRSGYPNAFPRPRGRKVLETARVIVWDYSWTRGQPTPMHYHDKDVVVVYLAAGALRSTTPAGQETLNDYKAGDIRFNLGDRVHSEDLAMGDQRAIIVELK
jgi:quercetin dioxygenase-like cupin family protein